MHFPTKSISFTSILEFSFFGFGLWQNSISIAGISIAESKYLIQLPEKWNFYIFLALVNII